MNGGGRQGNAACGVAPSPTRPQSIPMAETHAELLITALADRALRHRR
jgi:hypothetical protein